MLKPTSIPMHTQIHMQRQYLIITGLTGSSSPDILHQTCLPYRWNIVHSLSKKIRTFPSKKIRTFPKFGFSTVLFGESPQICRPPPQAPRPLLSMWKSKTFPSTLPLHATNHPLRRNSRAQGTNQRGARSYEQTSVITETGMGWKGPCAGVSHSAK